MARRIPGPPSQPVVSAVMRVAGLGSPVITKANQVKPSPPSTMAPPATPRVADVNLRFRVMVSLPEPAERFLWRGM